MMHLSPDDKHQLAKEQEGEEIKRRELYGRQSAFPLAGDDHYYEWGLSKREHFALTMLAALVTARPVEGVGFPNVHRAQVDAAIEYADCLIERLAP